MSDQRTHRWGSGRLIATSILDFWQASRTEQDPSIPNLPLETPAAVAGEAPFSADWLMLETPVRARLQAGYIAPAVNLLTTTLAVAATVLVARDPLLSKRPAQPAPQTPQVTANLNETTLAAVAVQAPFKQQTTDRVSARHVQQPLHLANTLTLQTVQAPLGTVLFVQPRAVPVVQDVQQQNLLPLSSVPPAAAPFIPYDWPQARRPADWIVSQSTEVSSYRTETDPTRQSDWQNPVVARRVVQPDLLNNLLGKTLTDAPPAVPSIPALSADLVRAKYTPQSIDPQNLRALLSAAPAAPPFHQDDWPNPAVAKRAIQTELQNGVIQVLTFTPPMPFRQSDWQNPQRLDFKLTAQTLETASYISEGVPVQPVDWPRQIIARQVQQPAPVNGVLQLLTYVASPLPKNISDWPNPILPILPVQDTAQYQNPDLITPYVTPVVTSDTGGGWWPEYRHVRHMRDVREHRRREIEREQREIQDATDREIARLLAEQEAREAESADLIRLQALADKYAARVPELPKAARIAILNAYDARTRNSLEQMQRVLDQIELEEHLALIAALLLDDDD